MCLCPKKIPNPKCIYDLQGGQKAFLTIKCNKCAECLAEKKNEWMFRSLAQAQSTFDQGGYLYSVCLTYAPEYVPHISDFINIDYTPTFVYTKREDNFDKCIKSDGSIDDTIDTVEITDYVIKTKSYKSRIGDPHYDFMCFSRDDLRGFFKRLRRKLEYRNYSPKDNLKYLITAEYGTKETGTHRPHYHCLFYVTDPSLTPIELSKYVDECWQFGRTDSYNQKGFTYVREHTYGKGYNTDNVELMKACTYVTKYITKDSVFQRKVEKRLNKLFNRIFGYDWRHTDNQEIKDIIAAVRRMCNQFHLQSNGFGAKYDAYRGPDGQPLNTLESIMESGVIKYYNQKSKVYGYMPLPMYYQRKLFYEQHELFNHRLVWDLTAKGKEFKQLRESDAFKRLGDTIVNWHMNMTNHDYYSTDTAWYDRILGEFNRLIGDRTLGDFVEYIIAYKGRIKSEAQRERESNGIYVCDPLDDFMSRQYRDLSKNFVFHYSSDRDFGVKFISKKKYYYNEYYDNFEGVKFGDFSAAYVISDRSDPKFENFDRMYDLFCESQLPKRILKQKAFIDRECLNNKMKDMRQVGHLENDYDEIYEEIFDEIKEEIKSC